MKAAASIGMQDEFRIYFRLKDGDLPWPTRRNTREAERYFSIDRRGCSALGSAAQGCVASAVDLHRFAGHQALVFDLPTAPYHDWHEHLRSHFMPVQGCYSMDDICRAIGEGSRKLVRMRVPSALEGRFSPDSDMDRWFAGSQVVEPNQEPTMLFRAVADCSNPGESMPQAGPIWFAADGAWATRMGKGPDLAEAVFCIKNPLALPAGLTLEQITGTAIPEGYDGILVQDEKGRIEAAAAASIEQIRFAGAASPIVEAWYESWRSTGPQAIQMPDEIAANLNDGVQMK